MQDIISQDRLNYDIAEPKPEALVESLRAFGYSLKTAIADLIDNSIVANAKNVWVNFHWDGGNSHIFIKDDGIGMDEKSLMEAMRPGSQGPLVERSPDDLGRYGLGLKTASFSQCRRLTVISKKLDTLIESRCWDLDYINSSGEWRLLKIIDPEPLSFLKEDLNNQGTIVLWQKMDRIVGDGGCKDDKAFERFLESIDEVKDHLGMVFHRYLEKTNGLKIWINNRSVVPWDPFLKTQTATQELPTEKLDCDNHFVIVTPYILPHKSKISAKLHSSAAGPKGWNGQQGFYIYRNERMLVSGGWLGLGYQKDEIFKLARIKIDLPNTMDSAWQIDVKKSRASLPGYLKEDLKRIAARTRENAAQIYRHRGKVVARQNSQNFVFLWEQKLRHGKYFYSINREHPLVKQAYHSENKGVINGLLSLLEETLPITHILLTNAGDSEKFCEPFENTPSEAIKEAFEIVYKALYNSGYSTENAIKHLSGMDPFNNYPEYVAELIKQNSKEAK